MRKPSTLDWALCLPALLLSLSGLVYVYSAAWVRNDPPGPAFGAMFIKQVVFLVIALAVFQFMHRFNWGARPATYWFVLAPALLLLVLVQLIGHTSGTGAKSWISLGPIDMQPSEFAKLAFIISLAWLFSDEAGVNARHFRSALLALLLLLGLVLAQPDLGTSLVFVFTFFVVGLLAGVRRGYLLAVGLSFALLAIPGWIVAKQYQRNRIHAWINPERDPAGFGYQHKQSEIAIGSGGLFGKGFLRGTQVQYNLVPVVESDFIFALIGEEFGFAGCAWVLALLFMLQARILALARLANTQYERLICYGASAAILCHVLIAVGMTIRLTPITGLPLPFVSYGGSALLTMWVLVGMCQSVYANTRQSFTPERRIFNPQR